MTKKLRDRQRDIYARWGMGLWIGLISAVYSIISFAQFDRFKTGGWDLGIYDQAVWQSSQFLGLYSSIKERWFLGDHLNLTLPMLAPLYWVWDDVRMLLAFQAVFITASSWAVFLIGRGRGIAPIISFFIAAAYSLLFGIQFAIFYEFHPIVLGVGLLAWLAYALESDKKRLFWMVLILALLTQENMGLGVASIGIIYLFHPGLRRRAMGLIVLGVVYNLFAVFVVWMLSNVGYAHAPRVPTSLYQILTLLGNTEQKQLTWLYTLTSFSGISLISPGASLAVVIDLFQFFVLGDHYPWMQLSFDYHRAILGVYLALGALDILGKMKSSTKITHALGISIFVGSFVATYLFNFPIWRVTQPSYWNRPGWMREAEDLFARIPSGASVATQNTFASHLSHRRYLHVVKWYKNTQTPMSCSRECWWLDLRGRPAYLVVSRTPDAHLKANPGEFDAFQQALRNMERAGEITIVDQEGSIVRYKVRY